MASLVLLVKAIMTCRQETNDNLMATKEVEERYVDDMSDRFDKINERDDFLFYLKMKRNGLGSMFLGQDFNY